MNAIDLIKALKKKLGTQSNSELAEALGVSVQTLSNWNSTNRKLTSNQIAAAIAKSRAAAVEQSQLRTIRPIVEFYELDRDLNASESAYLLFPSGDGATLYAQGLRSELDCCHGIYIFYDSRGRGLYVGKARQQSLWKEMNLAFNRPRTLQKITLVSHPDRNQQFRPGHEQLRQPRDKQLELADLAAYFSAYQVDDGMIEDLEALMVRGFANDLLNKKMETFAHSRKR